MKNETPTKWLAMRANKLERMQNTDIWKQQNPAKWEQWYGACQMAARFGLISPDMFSDCQQSYVDAMYSLGREPTL